MSKKKINDYRYRGACVNCNDRCGRPCIRSQQQRYSQSYSINAEEQAGALLRLLLVQDKTKAFAYVAQAEAAGKYRQIKLPQSIIFGPNIIHNSPRLSY